MPETFLEPTRSVNAFTKPGDFDYPGTVIDWDDTSILFGRTSGKTPSLSGFGSAYEPSVIPLGATVVKAALIQYPVSTEAAGTFSIQLRVLAPNTRLNRVTHQFHDSQFVYFPDYNVFPALSMWDESSLASGDVDRTIAYKLSLEHGIGNLGQVWESNRDDDLFTHYWMAFRSGALTGVTLRSNLWTVAGSPGNYYKDTLLDLGQIRFGNDLATGSMTAFFLVPTNGTLGLTNGTLYYSEFEVIGGSGSAEIYVGTRLDQVGGAVENSVIDAKKGVTDRLIDPFGGYAQFHTAQDVEGLTSAGTDSTVIVPTYTVDVLEGFGDAAYSSGAYTVVPGFTPQIQAALDARTSSSDRIAVLWERDGSWSVNGRARSIRGLRHASPTLTSPSSLFGQVLKIDWIVPVPPASVPFDKGLLTGPRAAGVLDISKTRVRAALASGGRIIGVGGKAAARIQAALVSRGRTAGGSKTAGRIQAALVSRGRTVGESKAAERVQAALVSRGRTAGGSKTAGRVAATLASTPRVKGTLRTREEN